MLALAAAAIFGIAFILHAAEVSTNIVFSPTSLMLVGLALAALHLAGVGSGWATHRGRRR